LENRVKFLISQAMCLLAVEYFSQGLFSESPFSHSAVRVDISKRVVPRVDNCNSFLLAIRAVDEKFLSTAKNNNQQYEDKGTAHAGRCDRPTSTCFIVPVRMW
jgi:hypothetical protein